MSDPKFIGCLLDIRSRIEVAQTIDRFDNNLAEGILKSITTCLQETGVEKITCAICSQIFIDWDKYHAHIIGHREDHDAMEAVKEAEESKTVPIAE